MDIDSETYEDWLYHNVCPWCDEFYNEVDHEIGCPNPKPEDELSPRAKRLKEFSDILLSIYGRRANE